MDTIKTIEDKLGYGLPEDYKDFLLNADKSQYQYKKYDTLDRSGYRSDGQIDYFSTIESFSKDNLHRSFLEEHQAELQIPRDYLESEYLFIIARCDYQSICMALNGTHKGKIYCADNGDFGIIFQSKTLNEFLRDLY
jgi:hypothetical protein